MQKSINFFHNDNKILSAFDNVFFVKTIEGWERVENVNVFKGTEEPSLNLGKNVGDYYIKYEEVGNYLAYSEKFDGEGWSNVNNKFIKSDIYFPYSESSKMIPNMNLGEHSISTTWSNSLNKVTDWCFSIYIKPNEITNFELIMSDSSEEYGVKMIVTMYLNNRKKYVRNIEFKEFGNPPENELFYDDNSYGLLNEKDYFRAYISCAFRSTEILKVKLKLLKLVNGELTDNFKNNNDTNGLFINSAQLTKSKVPLEYILCTGYPYFYYKFNSVYKFFKDKITDEKRWDLVSDSTTVWYGDKNPNEIIGQEGDLYFHNPIIKVGEFVRFGSNTLFKCWAFNNAKYYTEYDVPKIGDSVYNNNFKKVGTVTEYGRFNTGQPYIKTTAVDLTLTKNPKNNERRIKDITINDAGVVFWNKDAGTYGYINGEGKICNLSYNGKSLYNFKLFLQALTYSTNLFMETWDSHYTTHQKQMQMGFNTGGHGNFLDYNSVRYFY